VKKDVAILQMGRERHGFHGLRRNTNVQNTVCGKDAQNTVCEENAWNTVEERRFSAA
jgi:hypothetical protein